MNLINNAYSDLHQRILDVKKTLTFAWEDAFKTMETASKQVLGTEVLIIIGYSFPFLNREVDRLIFDKMQDSLTKIYFQDPMLDGKFLRTQFNLTKNCTIKHIKDTNQFHVSH